MGEVFYYYWEKESCEKWFLYKNEYESLIVIFYWLFNNNDEKLFEDNSTFQEFPKFLFYENFYNWLLVI